MSEATPEPGAGRVEFTGSRHELLGIVLRGYLLMIPSIGLYRFWQATWKRRFYWQNTVIDGEPIEYTGTPSQLLLGFFFALAFFLPIYVALFYLSMQESGLVVAGYLGLGALFWFLMGYGVYRARDFRLSRTLWRGIRFNLHGNAWAYGARRFLWSIANLVTLGLAYPWMASSLWRYRWRHTWYGDRRFEIKGNWRAFAAPYFGAYAFNLVTAAATAATIVGTGGFIPVGTALLPGPLGLLACLGWVVLFALSLAWYRARSASRMLSTITLGDAALSVSIPAGALFGQYVVYVLAVLGTAILLALVALLAIGGIYATAASGGDAGHADALASAFQSGTLNVLGLIAVYLVILGIFGLLSELILSYGWWRLLARSASFTNPQSLRSVRASTEDKAVIGQGLADALNVGAY